MKKLLTGCLLALTFSACTSVQPITFERLEAADVSFPETVRRIAVVNNVPPVAPASEPGVLSTWMEGEGPVAAESLAEEIASTRYFEEVVLADSGATADALGADLLVSLDRVILHARRAMLVDEELLLPQEGVEVVITPVLRVYLPGREGPMFTLAPSDSISWYASSHPTDSLVRREASTYAGGIPLHHLIPHWQEIGRFYYDGGMVDMRDAGVYVRESQWSEAAALWQKLYEGKKGKNRRQAAYNLALYHEMQDELPEALTWIGRALDGAKAGTSEYTEAETYRLRLEERASSLAKLNAQMERFDKENEGILQKNCE